MEAQRCRLKDSPEWREVCIPLAIKAALGLVAARPVAAQGVADLGQQAGYKLVHKFTGGLDGSEPRAGVIVDTAGNLYGTTQIGGYPPCGGCGTVFKLDPSGKETVLHRFGRKDADGILPDAGVTRDAAGNLYGTTSTGGSFHFGTVYKIYKGGRETVLYNFTGGADQAFPQSG